MSERSKLEINVRRLLKRCELMAKDDQTADSNLEMYVEALQDMIEELQSSTGKPCRDVMVKYIKRVEFLKGILNTKKLENPVERAVAAQMLPSNIIVTSDLLDGPSLTTQIHQKTTAKYGKEIREELFRTNSVNANEGLRQRQLTSDSPDEDFNDLLKYNRNMQEKIAENMILLTNNMKEHALTASAIIRKDINAMEKSNEMTDHNTTKLRSEAFKLGEHTKSTWRCWLWLMLAFVVVVFFNMLLFMKVAKKRI